MGIVAGGFFWLRIADAIGEGAGFFSWARFGREVG